MRIIEGEFTATVGGHHVGFVSDTTREAERQERIWFTKPGHWRSLVLLRANGRSERVCLGQ